MNDLLGAFEGVSGRSLDDFYEAWLHTPRAFWRLKSWRCVARNDETAATKTRNPPS
jgi:hypothetical protein